MILNFLDHLIQTIIRSRSQVLNLEMVFLVTMALGARSSEINALRFAELGFEDNYKFAVLSTVSGFNPKTIRLS